MIRRPPRSTRTDTLFPYTTLFRSKNVVLPTLGPERRETYSPFLPLCPRTGRVLQVPVLEVGADAGTVVYQDEYGRKVETPVIGGQCKLQWKAAWADRKSTRRNSCN